MRSEEIGTLFETLTMNSTVKEVDRGNVFVAIDVNEKVAQFMVAIYGFCENFNNRSPGKRF